MNDYSLSILQIELKKLVADLYLLEKTLINYNTKKDILLKQIDELKKDLGKEYN